MKKPTKKQVSITLIVLALLLAAYFILPVSIPLILAFLTALILNPLVRLITNRLRLNRKLAVTLVFLLFIICLGVVGFFTVTKTIGQIVNFAENVPSYMMQLNQQLGEWEAELDTFSENLPEQVIEETKSQIQSTTTSIGDKLREVLTIEQITSIIGKVPEYLISFIVYLIALFMFMLEVPRLKVMMYNHLKDNTAEKVSFMTQRLANVFFGFFKAQFLVSLVIFIVTLIGLYIILPEYALLMSLIIWVIDLVPILGSIIILGPWCVYVFFTGDVLLGTQLAILAIILLAIRRTMEPKVMGTQIGLSPLATLISMYIGLKLLGIFGFIIGPLIVILYNSAKESGIIKTNFKI
ncbi:MULTISPECIES: sporulation integral membrane protein YtvI [Gracilibacillus]|uniref:sporulation integral membrane protein YtvI n=1 Tax=Gracilibacillus TaxID=74385 RepID=UPI0008244532|nr:MULTISPECIES: sporulation integral membrane protein YtvI [Gracilibacillus]